MTPDESVDDYFKNIISALEKDNVEDLIYARRDYYNIMPADPSFPVDSDFRENQTAELTKLATTFWDNQDIEKDLEAFPKTHFPELKDWLEKLKTVAEEKKQLQLIFETLPKAPETTIKFFKNFLTCTERKASEQRKDYLLKLQSNKQLVKWHKQVLVYLQRTAPQSAFLCKMDIPVKKKFASFRLFKPSSGDNSGNIGCLIFIIIWMLIRFIGAVI